MGIHYSYTYDLIITGRFKIPSGFKPVMRCETSRLPTSPLTGDLSLNHCAIVAGSFRLAARGILYTPSRADKIVAYLQRPFLHQSWSNGWNKIVVVVVNVCLSILPFLSAPLPVCLPPPPS